MIYDGNLAEFEALLNYFKADYASLVERDRAQPAFLCTSCWLHGPALWRRLTKGRASDAWCELMNSCMVQALDSALFFGHSLEAAQAHFLDYGHLGFMSDLVQAEGFHAGLPAPPPGPQESCV